MPELRHMLSDESLMVLRAVQAQSEDPTVVELMTRSELYDHFAIRGKMGASEDEILAKLRHWKDARDIQRVMNKANRLKHKRESHARRQARDRELEASIVRSFATS